MCVDNFTLPTFEKLDPIKNLGTAALIQETQSNVFVIRALTGFRKNNMGFYDVRMPIIRNMSSNEVPQDRPLLAKAHEYEMPELGIVKDKLSATIYNNLLYLRND